MKEIHFALDDVRPSEIEKDFYFSFSWKGTKDIIEIMDRHGEGALYTYSMGMLTYASDLFERGWRVFIHDDTGAFEVKLGVGNERTNMEIKPEHNIFKLWLAGEFANKCD